MTINDSVTGGEGGDPALMFGVSEPAVDQDGDPEALVVLDALAEGVVVLRVHGPLDLAAVPMLRQVIDRAARQRPRVAVVDLSGVEFLASVGMAELLRAQAELNKRGAALRVVAATRVVLRPLMLTRLIDEFDMYPTLDEAVTGR